MTPQLILAAGSDDSSMTFPVVFGLAGLVAIWCGVSWAFDVRGIASRRSENIRRRTYGLMGQMEGRGTFFSHPWYLRTLGAVMAVTGLLLVAVSYALFPLG